MLLSGNEAAVDSTIPWVNVTLHYAMPVILSLDWIVSRSYIHRRYGDVLVRWLVFPFAYLTYSLLGGKNTGWYPYPFLNPDTGNGYAGAPITALIITVAFRPLVLQRSGTANGVPVWTYLVAGEL
ncbi:MAG: Pr6Pr family membrane protein [Candidatus Baltobacteraceae bacterium]